MANRAKILPNHTFTDYLRWEGRWELIDGIPYAMSPMASPRHQKIASKLSVIFDAALDTKNCSCQVYQPIDLKISETTVLNPDLLIVCKPIEKQFLDFPPELVVEVLSPFTRLKDKNTKFDIYEAFGIKYYIMVDPESNSIEVYQLNAVGVYQLQEKPYSFSLAEDCAIQPDFGRIW